MSDDRQNSGVNQALAESGDFDLLQVSPELRFWVVCSFDKCKRKIEE